MKTFYYRGGLKVFTFKGVKIHFITGKESNNLTKHKQCYIVTESNRSIVGFHKFYSERNAKRFINHSILD